MYLLIGTLDAEIARLGPAARRSAISDAFSTTSSLVDDEVDEAEAVRLFRLQPLARHQEVLGAVHPDEQRPDHLAAVARADAHADVGVGEHRPARRDHDVAQQRDGGAQPHRIAAHRADHRLLAVEEVVDDLTRLAHGRARTAGTRLVVAAEVAARAERSALTGHHQHLHLGVGVGIDPQPRELVVHPPVDRVEPLGPIERGARDAVGTFVDEDRFVVALVQHHSLPEIGGSRFPTVPTPLPTRATGRRFNFRDLARFRHRVLCRFPIRSRLLRHPPNFRSRRATLPWHWGCSCWPQAPLHRGQPFIHELPARTSSCEIDSSPKTD